MENRFLQQWHETRRVEKDGLSYFIKKYQPESYEIKNEISWLLSTMLRSCSKFELPRVFDFSISDGEVKMGIVDDRERPGADSVIDFLTECAAEIHGLIKSDSPHLRQSVAAGEYGAYTKDYISKRFEKIVVSGYELPKEIWQWMLSKIDDMSFEYFTVVHRDMRQRHVLFPEGKKPVFIDWEFTNISEPAQDLAKLIYDATVSSVETKNIARRVIDNYAYITKMPRDLIEERTMAFLPIIPLEHAASFVSRRPDGFEDEVLKDLYFISSLYEKEN